MDLDINRPQSVATSGTRTNSQEDFVATVRVIGVAAASAVTELGTKDRTLRVGDVAELTPNDAAAASENVLSANRRELVKVAPAANPGADSASTAEPSESHFVRSQRVTMTRG